MFPNMSDGHRAEVSGGLSAHIRTHTNARVDTDMNRFITTGKWNCIFIRAVKIIDFCYVKKYIICGNILFVV